MSEANTTAPDTYSDPSATSNPTGGVSQIEKTLTTTEGEFASHTTLSNTLDAYFYRQFVRWHQFTWTADLRPPTKLITVPVHPKYFPAPYTSFISHYQHWAGGFEVEFKIAGTSLHGGKLVVAYLPPGIDPDQVDNFTIYSHVFIDPKPASGITFKVQDQRRTAYHYYDDLSDHDGIGGHFVIAVYQGLVVGSDGLTNLDVTLSFRLAPEFSVATLAPSPVGDLRTHHTYTDIDLSILPMVAMWGVGPFNNLVALAVGFADDPAAATLVDFQGNYVYSPANKFFDYDGMSRTESSPNMINNPAEVPAWTGPTVSFAAIGASGGNRFVGVVNGINNFIAATNADLTNPATGSIFRAGTNVNVNSTIDVGENPAPFDETIVGFSRGTTSTVHYQTRHMIDLLTGGIFKHLGEDETPIYIVYSQGVVLGRVRWNRRGFLSTPKNTVLTYIDLESTVLKFEAMGSINTPLQSGDLISIAGVSNMSSLSNRRRIDDLAKIVEQLGTMPALEE